MRRPPARIGCRIAASLVLGVLALAGGGAVAVTFSAVGPAGEAGAEPVGSCSTTIGAIVAVDFSHWGGDVERGCAVTPTTGYQALHTAGFTTAGDVQAGAAYICRIDTDPPSTATPCVDTPPASAFWSYWHADAGQNTWTYSQVGAMTYRPPPGSVTAWTFGAGPGGAGGAGGAGQPSFSPSDVRADNITPAAPAPAPATTTTTTTGPPSPPAAPATTPGAGTSSTGTAAPVAEAGAGGQQPAANPGDGSSTAGPSGSSAGATSGNGAVGSGGPGTTTVPSAVPPGPGGTAKPGSVGHARAKKRGGRPRSSPAIVDAVPASSRLRASTGSPLPLAIGAALVVVLVAGGGLTAWRRRRRRAG